MYSLCCYVKENAKATLKHTSNQLYVNQQQHQYEYKREKKLRMQLKRTQQESMCTQYTNKNKVAIEFSRKREHEIPIQERSSDCCVGL